MKVAFVNARYAPNELGGAERTVRTLAEALVQRGHEVAAISLSHSGRAEEGMLNGVRTHYVPLANIHQPWAKTGRPGAVRRALWHLIDAYNPVMGRRVGHILDRERPDLVQTSNLFGFSVAVWHAARKRRIPVVQMLHDYYLGCANSSMFRAGRNCVGQCSSCQVYSLPSRTLSNIPSAVISLSRRTLDKLEDCGLFTTVPDKAVIHGASNVQVYMGRQARLDAAPGGLTVGYLGRIDGTKGIEVLLRAVCGAAGNGLRVLLGGSGDEAYIERLKREYASPRVEFLGYVKPAALFECIDFLVVPSTWEEPLGRVIYEAYAHGVPVIVARAGGMPEIVDEGRTGFVVDPGDAAALAQRLSLLARQRDDRAFFDACIAKSMEFDIERRFAQYFQVWSGAAARAGP